MSTVATFKDFSPSQSRITNFFGLVGWAAVGGVVLSWWILKAGIAVETEQRISVAQVLSTPLASVNQSRMTLNELGDTAFIAGDIVTPEGDNALYYYQQALVVSPADADARRGINQVVSYLLNEAQASIYRSDYEQARQNTAIVLSIEPANIQARDIDQEVERLEQVAALLNRAVVLYAAGILVAPEGDSASALYTRVLEIDPDNEAAHQGIESVVQRLVANAESSIFAGDLQSTNTYLSQIRMLDPEASDIQMLEQVQQTVQQQNKDRQIQERLELAAQALQADMLMPPAEPNAFSIYQEVLTTTPDSEAAQRGLELVRSGLLDRARTLMASNNMAATVANLDAAERAGASADTIAQLRDQAQYRQRLLDAEAGRFDKLYSLADLVAIERDPPAFPRNAPPGVSGEVDLHLTVTPTGSVRDIEALGNPRDYFERAAIQAVRNWRFEPLVEDGRPVPVRVAVRVVFRE